MHSYIPFLALWARACAITSHKRAYPHNRMAVVANYHKKADIRWISKHLHTVEVGINSSRWYSESLPWLQWIYDNYDSKDLPQYVVFLHGPRISWHSQLRVSPLINADPERVQMLSKCVWRDFMGYGIHGHAEWWGVELLYKAFFGMYYKVAWKVFNMKDRARCCTEMIVNTNRIKLIDRSVFKEIIDLMHKYPGESWHKIWERVFQNLFEQNVRHNTTEILEVLRQAPEPTKNSPHQHQRLMRRSAEYQCKIQ